MRKELASFPADSWEFAAFRQSCLEGQSASVCALFGSLDHKAQWWILRDGPLPDGTERDAVGAFWTRIHSQWAFEDLVGFQRLQARMNNISARALYESWSKKELREEFMERHLR